MLPPRACIAIGIATGLALGLLRNRRRPPGGGGAAAAAGALPTDIVLKDDICGTTCVAVCKRVSTAFDQEHHHNVYKNEKKWLKRLQDTDIIPRLLAYQDTSRIIVTAYAGTPVTAATLPHDWEKQRDHILQVLRKHNCRHNDIKPTEILVMNGKLRLCDFGWASRLDCPCPAAWPTCLGDRFKAASGTGFDDEVSFNKSVYAVCARALREQTPPEPEQTPPEEAPPEEAPPEEAPPEEAPPEPSAVTGP